MDILAKIILGVNLLFALGFYKTEKIAPTEEAKTIAEYISLGYLVIQMYVCMYYFLLK